MNQEFLPARAAILYHLRHVESARYSELRRIANMESDAFKFHVRFLVDAGLIAKQPDGAYMFTPQGKEVANNLDQSTKRTLKQPKLSLLMVVSRQNAAGQTEYLFQKRLCQPYYEYWGLLSGPAQWGQQFEETAAHELQKQCGLTAQFTVRTFLRQADYSQDDKLLEDKLFVLLQASVAGKQPLHTWKHGQNQWMTTSALIAQPKYFALTPQALELCASGQFASYKHVVPHGGY